jgi:predicted ABC-type transport system involved in lysophospholipase L1 biosynthesis ATPase subunit
MAIAGLERITSGTIRVAGQELANLDEDALAASGATTSASCSSRSISSPP